MIRGVIRVGAAVAVVGVMLAWAGTHPLWLSKVGRYLYVDDGLRPATVAIALAGEPERVAYAAELVQRGVAEGLVLTPLALPSGAERALHQRQMRALAGRHGVPPDAILELPEPASSTFDETRRLRAFLEARDIDSAVVVTSPWHTRRSRMIFDDVFAGATQFAVVPVPERLYRDRRPPRPSDWWTSESGRRHVLSEYAKILAQSLGIR